MAGEDFEHDDWGDNALLRKIVMRQDLIIEGQSRMIELLERDAQTSREAVHELRVIATNLRTFLQDWLTANQPSKAATKVILTWGPPQPIPKGHT